MKSDIRVAVYGTLKQGQGNHGLLNKAPEYSGYILIDKITGRGFPKVKLGSTYKLHVEVYMVNPQGLARLDSLEGYQEGVTPTFYDRKVTKVNSFTAKTSEYCYVYEIVEDIPNTLSEVCLPMEQAYTWTGGVS